MIHEINNETEALSLVRQRIPTLATVQLAAVKCRTNGHTIKVPLLGNITIGQRFGYAIMKLYPHENVGFVTTSGDLLNES